MEGNNIITDARMVSTIFIPQFISYAGLIMQGKISFEQVVVNYHVLITLNLTRKREVFCVTKR